MEGAFEEKINWRFTKREWYTLQCTTQDEGHIATSAPNYSTIRWHALAHQEKTDFIAQRQSDSSSLRGSQRTARFSNDKDRP
jgi:hypothetical protein